MQLLDILSHMPFLDGPNMIFCYSKGVGTFTVPQSDFDKNYGIPPRVTEFQQWAMAIKRGDNPVRPIYSPLPTDSPNRVFCNPVISGDSISFIHNRSLFTATLTGEMVSAPSVVCQGIMSGYKIGDRSAVVKVPCAGGSQVLISDGQAVRPFVTSMTQVMRCVPYKTGHIFTGRYEGNDVSVYLDADLVAKRLTVNGSDIYKCHLTDDWTTAVHAVKTDGGVDERYLHADNVVLVPMPDFIRH